MKRLWLSVWTIVALGASAAMAPAVAQSRPVPQSGGTPFVTPLQGLLALARSGDVDAMFELGGRYEHGSNGAPNDLVQAAAWYTAGAKREDIRAIRKMGDFYLQGLGVKRDVTFAKSYYERAANRGDADSQLRVGAFFDLGQSGEDP